MKKYSSIFLLSTIALGIFTSPGRTESETAVNSEDVPSLTAMTCRQLLKSSGDERTNSLIFMHGYISGKKGETQIDAPALTNITEQAIDTCIDNPDRSAFEVLEEVRQ